MSGEELKKVEKYVKLKTGGKFDSQHDWDHLDRVRSNALKIVKLLDIKNIDLNLLQTACLLHDVPQSMFRYGPAMRHWLENLAVRRYLPGILKELDLPERDNAVLYKAICRHNFSIPYRRLNRYADIYTKVLQDADSIEFFTISRERSFRSLGRKYLFNKFFSIFSYRFTVWGRKHLGFYLNYPELAKYNWFT